MMIMNEKIKAAEVELTGLDGESLGVVSRDEALAMAKKLKVDLVCTSLMSSPPPCRLIGRGAAKEAQQKEKRAAGGGAPAKVKELRLTPHIEEHDYETKQRQAEKLLASGHAVQLVVKTGSAKESAAAKALLERLLKDLAPAGSRESGIQVSGKGAQVKVNPQ
ncbi:translation initiation factor IF-3 [Paenibacillus mucilaginosus]|uniref:translation initiation factor IF-3 n=1 Tax=Paenibacillus mucilaginosus TaxID=61624 RepID=UPI003D21A411